MGIFKSWVGRALLIVAGVCLWLYFVCRFPAASLFTLLVPPIIAVNLSGNPRLRNAAISIFVVLWLFIFQGLLTFKWVKNSVYPTLTVL